MTKRIRAKQNADAPDPGVPPSRLALREAILAWCDPALVADVRNAERRLTYDEHLGLDLALLADRSTLADPDRDRFFRAESHDYAAVRAGWTPLLHDLRRRLERGELHLEGVRLAPQRGTTREEISNSWAADMRFSVLHNTVSLGRDRFGAIAVSTLRLNSSITVPPPMPATSLPCSAPASEVATGTASIMLAAADADASPARRGRGRASSKPVIRQALVDNWDAVEAHVASRGGGPPVWSELARMLRKRMEKDAKGNSLEVIPHVETIRTRLRNIYADVLSEKAVRN